MRLPVKLLSFWLGSVLAVLVLVALFFQLSLYRYHDQLAEEELEKAFVGLDESLAEMRDQVRQQTLLLSARDDVISSINLISNYQDPDDYTPLVFDGEKWSLAEKLIRATSDTPNWQGALFDKEGRPVAFHVAPNGEGESAVLSRGIVSYKNGKPVYLNRVGLEAADVESTNPPIDFSTLLPVKTRDRSGVQLQQTPDGLALTAWAPIWRQRPGGLAVMQGGVALQVPLDGAWAEQMARRTGIPFGFELADGSVSGASFPSTWAYFDSDGKKSTQRQWETDAHVLQSRSFTLEGGGNVVVTFGVPQRSLDTEVSSLRAAVLSVLALVAVVMAPLGYYWIRRSFSNPVQVLMEGVRRMKDGDADALENFQSKDELGTLARALSNMAHTIQRREADLTQARDTLERRVEERTHDLTREIDVRAATEDRLRDSEQRFRDLAEAASDWFWETDASHRFTDIAGSGPSTMGKDLAAIIGHTRWEVVGQADMERMPDAWAEHIKLLQEYQPFRDFEYAVTGDDGLVRHVSVSGKPVFGDGGEFLGYRGTAHDVTERREMQLQLIQASKMATLGEMSTGVAHELNQPLNVIRMAVSNLTRKLDKDRLDDETLRDKLDKIDGNVSRAAAIIDHMRVFGRSEQKVSDDVNPRAVVENAASMVGEQLRLSGVGLDVEVTDECPLLSGNAVQLEQVVLNLLTNARDVLKALPSTATKTISVSMAPWTPERATLFGLEGDAVQSDCCVIYVRDSGGGIPLGLLDRIFEPFFTTKETGEGTGLGLSISYGIMKDMKGGLFVRNTTVGGAEFAVVVPTSTSRDSATSPPRPDQDAHHTDA